MICRECKVDKGRFWDGTKRLKTGQKVYLNEAGKWWNGHQCPDCKYAPKNLETDGSGLLAPAGFNPDQMTDRLCKKCSKKLPQSKYFYHPQCTPNVDYFDMADSYQAHYGLI